MRRVWIARHGHREDFVGDQPGGDWHLTAARPHDPGLSPLGLAQGRALGRRLADEARLAHIFASPFLRAIQTAHAVAEATGLTVKIEDGLGEWLNPVWFKTPVGRGKPADLLAVRNCPRGSRGWT